MVLVKVIELKVNENRPSHLLFDCEWDSAFSLIICAHQFALRFIVITNQNFFDFASLRVKVATNGKKDDGANQERNLSGEKSWLRPVSWQILLLELG